MNLETDNPDKGQLLQRSAHHRELLEEEVKIITERSEKILTNALVIGGALALTYFLVTGLSGSTSKKQKPRTGKMKTAESIGSEAVSEEEDTHQEGGVVSQLGAVLVAQVTGFLLSIAREKLVEYLQSQGIKKENNNVNS